MWNSFQWNKNVMLSCLVPFIFISPLTSFRFKCIWHKLFSSCPVKSRHKSTPNSYLFFPSPLPPLPFIPCYTFAPASISQSENQTLETRKGQECRDGAPLANCRLGVNVSLSPSCAHALSASSHFVSFLLLICTLVVWEGAEHGGVLEWRESHCTKPYPKSWLKTVKSHCPM